MMLRPGSHQTEEYDETQKIRPPNAILPRRVDGVARGSALHRRREQSRATHSGDPCGVQLQQVRADIASQPLIDPNIRAQVNEASAFCQQGEPEEAQRILDQVVQDMRTQPKTRIN